MQIACPVRLPRGIVVLIGELYVYERHETLLGAFIVRLKSSVYSGGYKPGGFLRLSAGEIESANSAPRSASTGNSRGDR